MIKCADARLSLGVYLLGQVDPAERTGLEAHLAACPGCRDELAGLAGLPALLRRTPVQLEQDPAIAHSGDGSRPSDATLDSLLAGAAQCRRQERRRLKRRVAATAVALLMVLAGLDISVRHPGWSPGRGQARVPDRASVAASDPVTHASADVGLAAREWGTAVTVRVTGVAVGTRCRLIAVGRDGRREVAASWQIGDEGYAAVTGATAMPRAELASLEIVTDTGHRLLSAPVGP